MVLVMVNDNVGRNESHGVSVCMNNVSRNCHDLVISARLDTRITTPDDVATAANQHCMKTQDTCEL